MSDPQTNIEIEDVLTSIRRLVSENDWAHKPTAPQQQNKAPATSPEPEQTPAADKFVLTPALRVVDEVSDESTESADEPVAEDSDATDLERMIAELEAAVHTTPPSYEPEGDELEDLVDQPQSFASDRMADIADAEYIESTVTAELAAPIAQIVADSLTEVEPEIEDGPLDSDDPDLTDLDENIDDYLAATPQFDEAMLRELVTDIVRSELQGALGERITRNVRKLVRREIYRALSSKSFE